MKSLLYVVQNPMGIHARPAALLAQACTEFKSSIMIEYDGRVAGPDEEAAIDKISKVLSDIAPKGRKTSALRVAFFGTKDYDRIFFSELSRDKGEGTYNVDIKYFNSRLTIESAHLAKGYDAVCIFVNDEAPRSVIEVLNECGVKLILLRCAGFNNVDSKAAAECGITVLRVPAYSPYAVAEHAMTIIQAANRRIHKSYIKVKDNNFALSGLLGLDLHNKVAGIMGTGRIGQIMANICKGYGMTVIGWDAFPNKGLEESGLLTYVTKEDLLRRADLISLHAPLVMGENGTYHLIDDYAISLMKDKVMLVNTSRGPLVDPEALIRGLQANKFHAVALDVYEGEDPNVYNDRSDEMIDTDIVARLTMFPNLILTSHQAFFTREALQAIAAVTMENARNFNENLPYGMSEVK